jgi:hypothetical protein
MGDLCGTSRDWDDGCDQGLEWLPSDWWLNLVDKYVLLVTNGFFGVIYVAHLRTRMIDVKDYLVSY